MTGQALTILYYPAKGDSSLVVDGQDTIVTAWITKVRFVKQ